MKVSKKNSKSVFAFGLLASQFVLLSNHVAFADQLESQVRQMADSNTAQQIDDAVRAGMIDLVPQNRGNGGPSNNAVNAALSPDDFEKAIQQNFSRIRVRFSRVSVRSWVRDEHLFGFSFAPTYQAKTDYVQFPVMESREPMNGETTSCLKKQMVEFGRIPGGLDAALAARRATLNFYFLNLNVKGEKSEIFSSAFNSWIDTLPDTDTVKGDEEMSDKLRKLGKDSDALINMYKSKSADYKNLPDSYSKDVLNKVTYIDLEGKCHFSKAEDFFKIFDARRQESADAAKSREDELKNLNDILEPKNKVGEGSAGAGQETKVTNGVSKATQTESSNSSQSVAPAETSASAAN